MCFARADFGVEERTGQCLLGVVPALEGELLLQYLLVESDKMEIRGVETEVDTEVAATELAGTLTVDTEVTGTDAELAGMARVDAGTVTVDTEVTGTDAELAGMARVDTEVAGMMRVDAEATEMSMVGSEEEVDAF